MRTLRFTTAELVLLLKGRELVCGLDDGESVECRLYTPEEYLEYNQKIRDERPDLADLPMPTRSAVEDLVRPLAS